MRATFRNVRLRVVVALVGRTNVVCALHRWKKVDGMAQLLLKRSSFTYLLSFVSHVPLLYVVIIFGFFFLTLNEADDMVFNVSLG